MVMLFILAWFKKFGFWSLSFQLYLFRISLGGEMGKFSSFFLLGICKPMGYSAKFSFVAQCLL